jgi:hypothetical protein
MNFMHLRILGEKTTILTMPDSFYGTLSQKIEWEIINWLRKSKLHILVLN